MSKAVCRSGHDDKKPQIPAMLVIASARGTNVHLQVWEMTHCFESSEVS